ncbi:type IVB secretion system protein IcmH/DotU [Actibacterium sp. 188UL27-1]|uniref:type IVB secretion system protein IcmH/DotU n=1 Tax=Actibacterium sp. 188UL27-1 TaxID=2786961 RepID=UPI0019573303|nr:type IVB secretion system protein IcmH/DotU [Actibacterium sp. 188UL27-1]MBM7068837.1 type IVB secretion system protein IcmH/DotU [Actibacterium sp. 188UL27-1]
MSDKKDGGKTVIRPMPGGGFGGARPAGGAQKTVIGGLGSDPFAPGGAFGSPQNEGGFGGGQVGDTNAWMGAKPVDQGFFPDMNKPAPVQRAPAKKISLDKALNAKISGHSSEANPLTAAAASLLILFGRLRSQVVDMHAVPLMQHVTEEIEKFEERVLAEGVDQHDALVAKYCLCGTADDIVQNLPGTDRSVWLQYSMVARFFNKRTSGVGFFQEVEKALQNPIHKYHLLELMLTCLQLGFEGQYRAMNGGDIQLQNVKRAIYEAMRRVRGRGDDDISIHWRGVELAAGRAFRGVPIWAVACFAAALMAGAYFAMRLLLVDEGNTLAARMVGLHPTQMIKLERSTQVAEYTPPPELTESDQLERITEALEGEAVNVGQKGDFIVLDVNNVVLFASGKSDVKPEFDSLAEKIAEALNDEPGPVQIVGHTDNVPLSGRGRFKNNFELSVARAESVADKLKPLFEETDRIEVIGKGEDEPAADNATDEGKAQNRRVEIMIQREDTL